MALDLAPHFDTLCVKNVTVYKLKDAEKLAFLSKLARPFRILYLSDEILEERTKTFGTKKEEEILEKIPDKGNIMSGEFAELLLYYFIPEFYAEGEVLNPPKWKWKQHKNRALQFTDVVVLRRVDPSNPSAQDYLIAVESKAQATEPKNGVVRLNDAIAGCEDDYVSRLAESLVYIKARYKDELNVTAIQYLERFMELPKYPSFKKFFKAVALIDTAYEASELNGVNPASAVIQDTLEVILITMDDLKQCYELVYQNMPHT